MTDRHFVFSAAGSYAGGEWEIGGELEADNRASFAEGVSAALTALMRALLDEYPGGAPFHITRLTIEQARLQ